MPAFRSARGLLSGVIALAAVASAVAPAAALAADATLDDRALTRSSKGWSDSKDSKAASGTLSKAKKKGATLTAALAAKDGGSIVVQVAKGRGSVSVSVGGKKKTTISTSAKKKALKSFSFKGSGTVKLTVTKLGGGVFIDAIKLKGVPQPGASTTPGTTTPTGPTPTPAPGSLAPAAPAPANLGPIAQVNTSAAGVPQDGSSVTTVAVSPTGRFVAFASTATNLVPGAADGASHVYIKNLATGAITIADVAENGTIGNDKTSSSAATQALTWKPDESEIAFASYANNLGVDVSGASAPYLYAKDLVNGVPTGKPGFISSRINEAAWSPDGKKIALTTNTNFCGFSPVPCNDAGNNDLKIYSWEVNTDKFTPISASASGQMPTGFPQGSYSATWSPDSSKIAFLSDGSALVPGDTNSASDIFVKSLTDMSIQRVSVGAGAIQGNGSSAQPAWSPDGTRVAFESKADNLAIGDGNSSYDVFVRDLGAGTTTVVSQGEDGQYKLFDSRTPRWSPDGSKIMFGSKALDLIPGYLDKNQVEDIYVKTLATGKIQLASVRPDGVQGNGTARLFGVLGNTGGWVNNSQLLFRSSATNFATIDGNAFQDDIFLKTLN